MKKRVCLIMLGFVLAMSLGGCKKGEIEGDEILEFDDSEDAEDDFSDDDIDVDDEDEADDEDDLDDEDLDDEEEPEDLTFEEDPYEGREWNIGIGYNNPPFAVTSEADSNSGWGFASMGGIDTSLLSSIAIDKDLTYVISLMNFDEMVEACKSGEIDGFMCGVEISEANKNSGMIFSDSYYEAEGKEYGFVIMNPNNQYLIDKFNEGLSDIKSNGEYDSIIAMY